MSPQRECGGRVVGVMPKGFRALQKQMKELEKQMRRGINLPVRDKSEDEDEVEKNVEAEVVLNPKEERFF